MIRWILITLLFLTGLYIGFNWWTEPTVALRNNCTIEDLDVNREEMERAIQKMGPLYNYTVSPDGTLRVNRGDGKWLVLKYKKGE